MYAILTLVVVAGEVVPETGSVTQFVALNRAESCQCAGIHRVGLLLDLLGRRIRRRWLGRKYVVKHIRHSSRVAGGHDLVHRMAVCSPNEEIGGNVRFGWLNQNAVVMVLNADQV